VPVEPVRLEPVQEQRLVTGELRAARRSKVAAQEPGLLIELQVEEGRRVKKGDVLARLDARRLDVALREVEAEVEAVEGLIEERKVTCQWRTRDLELYRESHERGAANPKELFDAEFTLHVAEARLRQAERQRAVTQARVDLLEERLADMTIAAPFDGVVVDRHAELGEWVGEGDSVVELVSTGRIEAWLDVPQKYFNAVAQRQVAITIDIEAAGKSITADQPRVIPQVDPRARAFSVIATLDDAGGLLAPGMSVTAWAPTGRTGQKLTIPKDALLRNETGAYVYVARGEGRGGDSADGPARAMMVRVEVLFSLGDRMVVESTGIKEGDLVVVEGNERLHPMMPVTPMLQETTARKPAGGRP
jgi:RND family efflux transporter MFP subunit